MCFVLALEFQSKALGSMSISVSLSLLLCLTLSLSLSLFLSPFIAFVVDIILTVIVEYFWDLHCLAVVCYFCL